MMQDRHQPSKISIFRDNLSTTFKDPSSKFPGPPRKKEPAPGLNIYVIRSFPNLLDYLQPEFPPHYGIRMYLASNTTRRLRDISVHLQGTGLQGLGCRDRNLPDSAGVSPSYKCLFPIQEKTWVMGKHNPVFHFQRCWSARSCLICFMLNAFKLCNKTT